jgi:hypothetical protein
MSYENARNALSRVEKAIKSSSMDEETSKVYAEHVGKVEKEISLAEASEVMRQNEQVKDLIASFEDEVSAENCRDFVMKVDLDNTQPGNLIGAIHRFRLKAGLLAMLNGTPEQELVDQCETTISSIERDFPAANA